MRGLFAAFQDKAGKSLYGRVPEWPKGADCKSVVYDFGGSNPPSPTSGESPQTDRAHTLMYGRIFYPTF